MDILVETHALHIFRDHAVVGQEEDGMEKGIIVKISLGERSRRRKKKGCLHTHTLANQNTPNACQANALPDQTSEFLITTP